MISAVPMNEPDPPPAQSESTLPPVEHSDPPLARSSPEPLPASPTDFSEAVGDLAPRHAAPVDSPPASGAAVAPLPAVTRIPLRFVVMLCVMVVAFVAFDTWTFWSMPTVKWLYYPVETALRIVERSMDFQAATLGAGPCERALLWLVGAGPERYAKEFPRMYREILQAPPGGFVMEENKPWLQAHLIVLLGELDLTNQLRAELESFHKLSSNALFPAAVRHVYLHEMPGATYFILRPGSNCLSAGWTQDRFAVRLAETEGRIVDARELESQILARGQAQYHRVMPAFAFQLALVFAALALLFLAWQRGGLRWRRGPDHSFAPWPVSDGMAILCGSLILGRISALLPLLIPSSLTYWITAYWYSLLLAIPAVAFVSLCLLRPHAARFGQHFGIQLSRRALTVSVGGAIVIAGLYFAGWQAVPRVLAGFGLSERWTAGLNETLLYGNWLQQLAVMTNMALVAPFVEELLFRGVLFGSLRKRMGPLAAAGASSGAFALIHLYSIPGLLVVFCFGFICALVYERTRDLGSCVAGHMLTNLTVGLFEIAWLG